MERIEPPPPNNPNTTPTKIEAIYPMISTCCKLIVSLELVIVKYYVAS